MNKIHILPEHVVTKIAAGEVIERPVYAVKELVENSLDAEAKAITILIEEGGLKSITVIDNGEGMSHDDIQESIKHHSTSKISLEEDLSSIETLGFRGEALSSIAAVSKMTLRSKTSDAQAGIELQIRNGEIEKLSPIGMPQGTTVIVENLFYSVPGRKKFLKSIRTEFRYIIDLVTTTALVNPHIAFSLTHNKKTIFDLHQTTDVLERIEMLLGKDIFANLLPLSYDDSYIKISGFIAKPQITTVTPYKQYLYINKRKITDRMISLAIKDAYGELLRPGTYPVCILFLSLPYETVDVNVHPRKEMVRFVNNQLIRDAIHKTIAETLLANNLTFHKSYWDNPFGFHTGLQDAPSQTYGRTDSYAGRLLKEKRLPWNLHSFITAESDTFQLHNLYVFTETQDGVLLIDQHAAHERILFEEFLDRHYDEKGNPGRQSEKSYELPQPIFVELSVSESELFTEYKDIFIELGFDIEHFKGTNFLLHSVPHIYQDRNYHKLIHEILEDLHHKEQPKELDSISRRMIAYLACRAAVKAGDPLTKKQCKELIEKLEKTANNATCPHGRPTKIEIPREQIDRLFKRR